MRHPDILIPIFALVMWTGFVLLLIPIARFRAGLRRQVTTHDFRFGESATVPASVSIPNRNYMNLLEAPLLFYVGCLVLYVTSNTSPSGVFWAWAYVALRVVHSLIHLTYNQVTHRLLAFALSNGALAAIWIVAGRHVAA